MGNGSEKVIGIREARAIEWHAVRRRAMLNKLGVLENVVRSRLEVGGPLTAQEMIDGVKLTHEDFLYLAELVRTLAHDDFLCFGEIVRPEPPA